MKMEKGEILAKVSQLGRRITEVEGLELVQVDLERQRGGWFLRLTIDKPGGVTLSDCQRVSEQMGAEMDLEDPVPGAYTLEVSSPGLDRPLRSEEDFRRFIGRIVAISTHEVISGQKYFVGRLLSYEEGTVTLVDERGTERLIPRNKISKARLEIEF